jgi:DNA-binding MarR family transcriptional regulator
MADDATSVDLHQYATPTLMRAARGVYAQSIRAELHAMGVDDLPRNGAFVLAGIGATGGPRADLPSELGVTKQAVSQVVDILVGRGYLERLDVPGDRRRVDLALTERGNKVLLAVVRAVEAIDHQIEARLSMEKVHSMREVLIALAGIKVEGQRSGAGHRRPQRQMRSASPIFPVAELGAALDHYQLLGFTTLAYKGGGDYGFADRDGVGIHFMTSTEEPRGRGVAYLYVRDADALYEEWTRPGVGGETHPVQPTDYKLREGWHVDPDGNVLRFGSPTED